LFLGTLLPFLGTMALFLGTMAPFLGTMAPFLGTMAPFLGTMAPFLGTPAMFLGTTALFLGAVDWFGRAEIRVFFPNVRLLKAKARLSSTEKPRHLGVRWRMPPDTRLSIMEIRPLSAKIPFQEAKPMRLEAGTSFSSAEKRRSETDKVLV
jgi:hypothetical protein